MTHWTDRAACRDHDPEMWFDLGAHSHDPHPLALEICAQCPVTAECRDLAAEVDGSPSSSWGIWAGLTPAQRHDAEPCKRGHAMTPDNTYRSPAGKRCCKECRRAKQRERDQKRRASV